jgi:hypothetical protein
MRCFAPARVGVVFGVLTVLAGAPYTNAQELTSTAESRRDVSLTVYTGDLCLIREMRTVDTRDGTFRLRYEDVTPGINPASVWMQAEDGRALRIVEQSYEYDLISKKRLMQKYVGREVGYRMEDGSRGTAKLLSVHEGYVFDMGGQIVFELPGDIVLDTLPSGLSARPTLVWTLEGERGGRQDVEVGYLSSGMSWRADYVLMLNPDETHGKLTGWMTLENRSGVAFENAQLRLVAGDVNRVREAIAAPPVRVARAAVLEAGPQFQEQASFEYHLYTLQRRTNLENNQTRQILSFDADGVAVSKIYRFRHGPLRPAPQYNTQRREEHVGVSLRILNAADNNLGSPIPAGIVRVYEAGTEGARQFLGEDRIDHTPKDELLEFAVGKAFDVVGERVQTDYRRMAERAFEVEFQVKLRNHREDAIDVMVEEQFFGDWKILSSSLPFDKLNATTAVFEVPVDPGGVSVLTYRARVQP